MSIGGANVQVVLGPGSLVDAVYGLWRSWKEQQGKEQWRAMSYLVDEGGEFTMNLTYPDDFDEDEDDRRARSSIHVCPPRAPAL